MFEILAVAGASWTVWCLGLAAAVRVPSHLLTLYLIVVTLFFTWAELIHAPLSNSLATSAAPEPVPVGQVGAVSPAELVNLWGGPVYTGYLVLAQPSGPGVEVLRPPSLPGGGLDLQNLAYALQWWIFGGFAVALWARFVRDEARAVAEYDDGADPA